MSSISINSSIRTYEVFFNDSLDEIFMDKFSEDDMFIIDKQIYIILPHIIKDKLAECRVIQIDAGEELKEYTALSPLINRIIENRLRRNHRLVAVGGGIIQDITGFISSILFRGVEWIFCPTTLLAQADSCIGGKTSINIGHFKNQLGNFYPPTKIFIIPELLQSLPERDFKSGMGEMLHFYLVSGEEDFDFYQRNYELAFQDDKVLLSLVKRNLEIKKGFIERDEFDRGERLLLNYGHSFGHAIESLTNFSIPHGIAVSYGMDMSNFISAKLGFIEHDLRLKIKQQLKKIWSGIPLPQSSVKEYETALSRDKKNIGNTYQLILTRGIGQMFKHGVTPNSEFTQWLAEYFQEVSK